VFEVRDVDAVAVPELAGLHVEKELGYDEQRQALSYLGRPPPDGRAPSARCSR
jgi:hypothetical protein